MQISSINAITNVQPKRPAFREYWVLKGGGYSDGWAKNQEREAFIWKKDTENRDSQEKFNKLLKDINDEANKLAYISDRLAEFSRKLRDENY